MDKSVRRLPVTDLATQMQSDHHSDVMQQILDHLHTKPFKPPAGNTITGNVGIRRTLQMGTYWSTLGMPTSDTIFQRAITKSDGSACQMMNAAETMPVAGSVLSLQGFANGAPGGTWYITVYKNGAVTKLTANTTGQFPFSNIAKGQITFVAGDSIAVYIRGSASGMNQSFSASIDIESVA